MKKYESWGVYGGNKENNHYSSLKQVDTANVAQLQVAWEYHSNDSEAMTQIQVNPCCNKQRAVWCVRKTEIICA